MAKPTRHPAETANDMARAEDVIRAALSNTAPVLDLDSGTAGLNSTASFTEGNSAVNLASAGTVIDADSPDFDGATLTAQFTSGAQDEDQLQIIGLDPDAGGAIYNGIGDQIAQVSGGSGPFDPLIIAFFAPATSSDVQDILRRIGFTDFSGAPSTTDRIVSFTLTDGDGGTSAPATATVHVTAVDTPPQLEADLGTTDENATVVIAVLVNDEDPDGPPFSITKIDGNAVSAGGTVTLASGAKVTVNNDGTLTYDPNHKFDSLTSPGDGETGAVNTFAGDSFTYTVTGNITAMVNVVINGVASAQDHLNGDFGDNAITGTAGSDYFDLSQGGVDSASGLDGDDAFFFGAALTPTDHVDGGAGTNDQLGLQGNYTGGSALTLGTGSVAGIEAIVVLPGFSYAITTNDGNVAAGALLKVQATQLAAGQNLTFNGSAETDGSFLIFGGNGNDSFTGGAGNDGFFFGPGQFTSADTVNGGAGTSDQLGLDGDYGSAGSPFLLGGNFSNIEVVVLLSGPAATPNHFNIQTTGALVPLGETMTIFALQTSTGITFDGFNQASTLRIYGGTGGDTLTGGTGNDWFFGGNGADTLRGGTIGGGGFDTFYYDDVAQSTAAAADQILDFATGDKIDVSGIDAIPSGANDAFTFLGSGAFTNHAGELRAQNTTGATWLVQGDTNGDGVADFQLTVIVSDSHSLTTADFTL